MAGGAGRTVNENCIVIDAGHGGDDPGKIGINGTLEKDINLIIAHKLKTLLESQGYEVVMTRSTGEGLYQPGTRNMKVEDMQKRCGIITETMPIFTVSIHQNSYPQEYVKGAQVFYFGQSKEGEELAYAIQLAPDAKGNSKFIRLVDAGIQGSFTRPSETDISKPQEISYRLFRAADIEDSVDIAIRDFQKKAEVQKLSSE